MTIIRSATLKDAEEITKIWNFFIFKTTVTFNSEEKSAAMVREMIKSCEKDGRAFLLAEDLGRILGFCTYFQFRAGIGYAKTMEHTILTSSQAKGLGIGTALIDALCKHAKNAGVNSLWAGVSADNTSAVKFHERKGFHYIARLPNVGNKFGRWIDLILLQKTL